MTPPYEIVTFDCYGTLIDWASGISDAFRAAAAADGVTLGREAVLAAHAAIEPEVQAEGYRRYRDVLIETAVRMGARLGWPVTPARARFLPDSLPSWTPFADTNGALARLAAAGMRLGILSNVDDDLLAGTLRHLTVPFELLVTAEQVGAYKPAAAHFDEAERRVRGAPWLHAAQSWFHDVVPALARGLPVVWVNRLGEPRGPEGRPRPTAEVADLQGLVTWLEGRPG